MIPLSFLTSCRPLEKPESHDTVLDANPATLLHLSTPTPMPLDSTLAMCTVQPATADARALDREVCVCSEPVVAIAVGARCNPQGRAQAHRREGGDF